MYRIQYDNIYTKSQLKAVNVIMCPRTLGLEGGCEMSEYNGIGMYRNRHAIYSIRAAIVALYRKANFSYIIKKKRGYIINSWTECPI